MLVNASGVTTFDGAVGNTGILSSLTTDAAGTTDLNGGTVKATLVDFQDAVVLTANTTITGTTVTFENTLNGDATANNRTLLVNASGVTTFDSAVGNTGVLSSLIVINASDVLFHSASATLDVTTLSITNTGSTTFDGTATINNSMTVHSGSNIIVNSAVSAAGLNTAIDLQAGSGTGTGNVTVTSAGSLLTTAAGSDIHVQAGATSGNIVLAGPASNITANDVVMLTAASGSITGLGTLTGTTVQLAAKTGINDGTASNGGLKTNAAFVSADNSQAFAVNIANTHATLMTVTSLTTVGADLTFTQTGGGDLTFTGAITSGSAVVNGGNIFLENFVAGSALTIANTATLSTAAGFGGGLTISGATINSTTPPILGAGNITIIGGSADTIVNSDLTVGAIINISALRDVIIGALVRTTGNPNASINVMADSDGDGIGGVEVLATGKIDSVKDVTISGSDLFATPAGTPDSVFLVGNGASDQVLAVGNISIASNLAAPSDAVVILDGQIHSTSGNVTLDAKSTIQAQSSITTDAGNVEFQTAVELTGVVLVAANGNVTFDSTVNGDATANNRTLLVNASGVTTFDSAVGNTGVLSSLIVINASDVLFHSASATLDVTTLSITNTGSTTFDGTATINNSMTVHSGSNIIVNSAVSAAGLNTAIDLQAGSGTGTGNVTVTSAGSLLTTAAGSDIHVQAGATSGNIVLAGPASNITANDVVMLTAASGSITGLGTLTGTTVQLAAKTGINDGTASNGGLKTNAAFVSADNSQAFAVNIANTHATLMTVTSLTTVGADLTFTQTGGGDLTFTGAITSGSAVVNGGNIFLENFVAGSALTIANTATLSTAAGFGGGLTISGATLDPTNPPIFGAGNITIIGGSADTIINSNLNLNGTINILALRDVVIGAVIRTTGNPNASINLMADSDGNGVGGVEVLATGKIDSAKDVTISGSDLFATSIGTHDSVLIIGNGASNQILAAGNITVASNSAAPSDAVVILNGQMTATNGTIFISAAHSILLGANLTVGTDLVFQQAVQLTSNVTLKSTGNGNITFQEALKADTALTTLTTDTMGNLAFQGNTNLSTLNATVQPTNITFGKLGGPAVTDVIINAALFLNPGTLTIGLNAGDSVTFLAGVTHTVGATNITGTVTSDTGAVIFATVMLNGTVQTKEQQVSVQAMTLTGNSRINTNIDNAAGANITINGTLNSTTAGIQGLILDAGPGGNVLFASAVGAGTRLGDLVVANAHNVTGQAGVTFTTASLVQSAGTGTTTLNGAVNTNAATGIHLTTNVITVNNTITTTGTGGVLFTNAGLLTINGNINSDGAVAQNGAGVVVITTPGTRSITTTGNAVSFLRAVALVGGGGLLSIDTTTSGNVTGGDVTFSSTLNSTTAAPTAERLLINAGRDGNVVFTGSVGGTARLGDIVIANAHNVTESSGIVSASLTQLTGTGRTQFDGAVDTNTSTGIVLTNGAITFNNTARATNLITLTALNPDGNITIASTIQTTQPSGTVSMTCMDGGIVNGAAANVVNVITNSLVMRTIQGIGSTGTALQTQVSVVAAHNTGSGNIRVDNLSAQLLTIGSISGVNGITNDGSSLGSIAVTNNSSILVSAFSSPTNAPITNTTGGNITLLTKGGAFDITVNSPLAAAGGNGIIALQSGHDVIIHDTGVTNDISVVGLGTVYLNAARNVVLGSQDPNTTSDVTQHTVANDVIVHTATGNVTNTLPLVYDIQSPQLDAGGNLFLTMTIGRPGESNITVTVYWGDGSFTKQTFAGPTKWTFEHHYVSNPNKEDQAAPILINVQVAHDPHVVLTALNVNTSTESVPDIGVANPPPVPADNINTDLSGAIYNLLDPNYGALHDAPLQDKILSATGTLELPGSVVFQDTSIRATVIPVPGEGVHVFAFDTTPPVNYLHFPERVAPPDVHETAISMIVQVDTLRLDIGSAEDAVPTERFVILEIFQANGSIERIRLSEDVLDDLAFVIGKLPDGRYRFLLQEPGETRQRLLLDLFEVRQGKIVDDNDTGDRPPSSAKKMPLPMNNGGQKPDMTDDDPADAEEAIRAAHPDLSATGVPPANLSGLGEYPFADAARGLELHENNFIQHSKWSSVFARRVWERAEMSSNELSEQSLARDLRGSVDASDEDESTDSIVTAAAHDDEGQMSAVMLVGGMAATGWATGMKTDRRRISTTIAGGLTRGARLFRMFESRDQ